MGKRILVQRRGRGSPTFKARSHKRAGEIGYEKLTSGDTEGRIVDIVHNPGGGAPLALIETVRGIRFFIAAPEGAFVGQKVEIGEHAAPTIGNILPLKSVPDGTLVSNVELVRGDGGVLARSSGAYVQVVSHTERGVQVRLPSGKLRFLSGEARAVIGIVAAGGRTEQPFLKAGKKYYWMKSRGRKWPIVKGNVMNPVSHPFGGKEKKIGKPKTVSRHAPPGKKVGSIAARRTGRGA